MKNKILDNYYIKNALVLTLSLCLILFTQYVKVYKYGENGPKITKMTIIGLILLGVFSLLGIFAQRLLQYVPIKFIRDFPILGCVSIVSLIFCIASDQVVQALRAVDFLSITTPILTYAGISIANKLGEIKEVSLKIAITGVFVFLGTYLGSALLAQIGLFLTGR